MAYNLTDYAKYELSIAMATEHDAVLSEHVHKEDCQEDLAFAYWRPSMGQRRFTAVITELVLPMVGERILQGNVAFRTGYLRRVLDGVPEGSGIAFIHGHPMPGWPAMSDDDIVAERDRIASAAAGKTRLPLVGLTRGTDGAWGGRMWFREARFSYQRRWARTVRVVGSRLAITYHPDEPPANATEMQEATLSVWGQVAQENLVRARVGIVGLGSVGSIVAESLSRVGLKDMTFIDHDKIEPRNLDRTLGASITDIELPKVQVAARTTRLSSTSESLNLHEVPSSLLKQNGLSAALDCDVLICCVDRPWPRFLLNALAYSHLIPVIDGGILATVNAGGRPQHVAWRVHTIGPGHACMVCLGALQRSDVALDRDGKLDDPDYVAGLSEEDKAAFSRRNVFPFSMSVAAHEVLQLVGLVTGLPRIGGKGPQIYDCYPGTMRVLDNMTCEGGCEFDELTATAVDLSPNLDN